MRRIVPVLKVGDKVTEYSEHLGVRRIGVVTKVEYYMEARCYFVQFPDMRFEAIYKASNLREAFRDGHGRHVGYIRPCEGGDEYKLALTESKRELRCLWVDVVDKITTMEKCEELKRVFEETIKESKMKKYTIYYTIKMNSTAYEYALDVEAANAQEAKKKCREIVLSETGRNAFQPSTKEPNCKCLTGLPPKKF